MNDEGQTSDPGFPQEPIDVVATPFQRFVHTETSGGVVLLFAAIAALVAANSNFAPAFNSFWETSAGLHVGEIRWDYPLRHWINDGLVTLFFFVIGLEIKREITSGELRELRTAALPLFGAIGGMAVPAALYLALAPGPEAVSGWGVVMATDIAFVVGCMALLGRRVPNSLRVFLLALAIVDDIGAILVIALGYSHGFHLVPFLGAVLGLGVTFAMQRIGVRSVSAYWAVGLLTWLALHESGIHPTIAGVALGLLTPVTAWVDPARLDGFLNWAKGAGPEPVKEGIEHKPKPVRRRLARAAVESLSPQQRLEDALHPWSAFLILPLFALANAGVSVSLAYAFDPVTLAVIVGLTVGKPLGIFVISWLAIQIGLARKPNEVSWPMLFAAGSLGGIGFTMSLFIANLGLQDAALQSAKIGILSASLLSGVLGMALIWLYARQRSA